MIRSEDDEVDESVSDEMKPEDGRLRYWTFINGEQTRLLSALAAGSCAVGWCFLYVLGAGRSVLGIVLVVCTCVSFSTWLLVDTQIKKYEESDWKKDRGSRRAGKIELWLAAGLWLFIVISICVIVLWQWRHWR